MNRRGSSHVQPAPPRRPHLDLPASIGGFNLAAEMDRRFRQALERHIWLGTVTDIEGNQVYVQRHGETSSAPYPRLHSYTPQIGDEVQVVMGVVNGKIQR